MRVFFADHQTVELPVAHRFPMGKYRALRIALVERGVLSEDELEPAPLIDRRALESVHDPVYVSAVIDGTLIDKQIRRLGFPWSPALVRRSLASVGGTLAATKSALEDGMAGVLAGGTHHAFRDGGAGFCIFNDLAVAATEAIQELGVGRVLVFDVDVHQGDGTAAIFTDEPRVFTCSVHGARNFPVRKQTSDLDVPLPDGTGDAAYLDAVDNALERALAAQQPELVLVQAGVDALDVDRLGRLSVSLAALQARDMRIFERLRSDGIPTALTLGGGYAEPIELAIDAHVDTYRAAKAAMLRSGSRTA